MLQPPRLWFEALELALNILSDKSCARCERLFFCLLLHACSMLKVGYTTNNIQLILGLGGMVVVETCIGTTKRIALKHEGRSLLHNARRRAASEGLL